MAGYHYPPHVVEAALTLRREPPTAETVAAELAELGTTADQVAESLFKLDCHGDRDCETSCVLAEWVWHMYPAALHVGVTLDETESPPRAWIEIRFSRDYYMSVEAPAPVAEMAIRFDQGQYPDLDRAVVEAGGS
jgi:hypothetical protein